MKKLLFAITLCGFIGFTVATTTQTQTTHKSHKVVHHKHNKKTVNHTKNNVTKTTSKHKTKHRRMYHNPHVSPTTAQYRHSAIPREFAGNNTLVGQPRLYSYSAIALNANTGKIIVSKNPYAQLPIASITKLMTAMVLLDSGVNLNDYVTITSADIDTLRNTYSRLKVGMQFRRKDLLLLALMSSENRAAHAIGRTTFSGGTSVFIRKMNEKAKSIGMTDTQFYDSTGLTNQNKSTVTDLSKMVEKAYTYDDIRKDTTTKNASVMFPHYVHRYINSDSLVRGDNFQIEVSKTGFINEAGHCLALYSIIDNKPIIMVFLNSTGKNGRIIDALAVKNYVLRM